MNRTEITIRKPDDMHLHVRNGRMLKNILHFTSDIFPRAVVMGNLPEPIDDAKRVIDYREEILADAPDFTPIMTVMLTKKTTLDVINSAHKAGARVLKFIPGVASTGGAQGLDLPDLRNLTYLLEAVREKDMIFSCHFELTAYDGLPIPKLHQEYAAIKFVEHIAKAVPELKMVVEHASSKEMIEFVEACHSNVAATLTAHHAILTYDDVRDANDNIINASNYCKPIAKTKEDRQAVRKAMTSGNRKFFFGSDSAPHLIEKKQGSNPAAGIFSAPVLLPLLCQIFEEEAALDKLENFVSKNGAKFYGLQINKGTIKIKKKRWIVPKAYGGVKIFLGNHEMEWQIC